MDRLGAVGAISTVLLECQIGEALAGVGGCSREIDEVAHDGMGASGCLGDHCPAVGMATQHHGRLKPVEHLADCRRVGVKVTKRIMVAAEHTP